MDVRWGKGLWPHGWLAQVSFEAAPIGADGAAALMGTWLEQAQLPGMSALQALAAAETGQLL